MDCGRSTGFFSVGASSLVFELLASSMVPTLMEIDTWLPIFLALGLYIPILACVSCLPKSLGAERRCSASSQPPSADDAQDGKPADDYKIVSISSNQQPEQHESSSTRGLNSSKYGSAVFLVLREDSNVTFLFFTFLVTVLSNSAQDNILQFARNRFGWSWSRVSVRSRPFEDTSHLFEICLK